MTTSIVVGRILLAADQQLGVEERAVTAGADLVDGGGVEIDKDGSGHIFAAAGLAKEGLVGAWVAGILDIGVGATIWSETVLEEVAKSVAKKKNQPQGPSCITRGAVKPYSSQALLPSWVPAWPKWR